MVLRRKKHYHPIVSEKWPSLKSIPMVGPTVDNHWKPLLPMAECLKTRWKTIVINGWADTITSMVMVMVVLETIDFWQWQQFVYAFSAQSSSGCVLVIYYFRNSTIEVRPLNAHVCLFWPQKPLFTIGSLNLKKTIDEIIAANGWSHRKLSMRWGTNLSSHESMTCSKSSCREHLPTDGLWNVACLMKCVTKQEVSDGCGWKRAEIEKMGGENGSDKLWSLTSSRCHSCIIAESFQSRLVIPMSFRCHSDLILQPKTWRDFCDGTSPKRKKPSFQGRFILERDGMTHGPRLTERQERAWNDPQ